MFLKVYYDLCKTLNLLYILSAHRILAMKQFKITTNLIDDVKYLKKVVKQKQNIAILFDFELIYK